MLSVQEEIEQEYNNWLEYLITKYGPMPENEREHLVILKDTFEAAFDLGWKASLRRSFENSPD